jgi:hypothetical protein
MSPTFISPDGQYHNDEPISVGSTLVHERPSTEHVWHKDKLEWVLDRRTSVNIPIHEIQEHRHSAKQCKEISECEHKDFCKTLDNCNHHVPAKEEKHMDKSITPETKFQLTLYQLVGLIVGVFTLASTIYVFDARITKLEATKILVEQSQQIQDKQLSALTTQMRDLEDIQVRTIKEGRK